MKHPLPGPLWTGVDVMGCFGALGRLLDEDFPHGAVAVLHDVHARLGL